MEMHLIEASIIVHIPASWLMGDTFWWQTSHHGLPRPYTNKKPNATEPWLLRLFWPFSCAFVESAARAKRPSIRKRMKKSTINHIHWNECWTTRKIWRRTKLIINNCIEIHERKKKLCSDRVQWTVHLMQFSSVIYLLNSEIDVYFTLRQINHDNHWFKRWVHRKAKKKNREQKKSWRIDCSTSVIFCNPCEIGRSTSFFSIVLKLDCLLHEFLMACWNFSFIKRFVAG